MISFIFPMLQQLNLLIKANFIKFTLSTCQHCLFYNVKLTLVLIYNSIDTRQPWKTKQVTEKEQKLSFCPLHQKYIPSLPVKS